MHFSSFPAVLFHAVTRTSDFLLPTSLQSEFRASPWLDQSVVDLGYAKYRGMHDEDRDVTEFLGMRYVQSPIGMFPLSSACSTSTNRHLYRQPSIRRSARTDLCAS